MGVKNLRLERSRALILNFGDGYVDVDYCTDGSNNSPSCIKIKLWLVFRLAPRGKLGCVCRRGGSHYIGRRNRHKLPVIQIISQSTHLYENGQDSQGFFTRSDFRGSSIQTRVCHMYNKLDNIMLNAKGGGRKKNLYSQ